MGSYKTKINMQAVVVTKLQLFHFGEKINKLASLDAFKNNHKMLMSTFCSWSFDSFADKSKKKKF